MVVNSLEKGGRTKRIVEEFLGLKARGHAVTLVGFSTPPAWVSEYYSHSEEWVIYNKSSARFDILLLFKLFKLFRNRKADLIHTHCESSSFYAGLAAWFLQVTAIGTIHRSELRYYAPTWRNRLFYRFLDYYIAVSRERKDRLVSQLGLDARKMEVIHWGIDPLAYSSDFNSAEIRKKLGLTKSGPMLFSLGHLGPIKGHEDSIEAVALLRKKNSSIRLYIAGDGLAADYERLHEQIDRLNLRGSVVLLGQITNAMEWMQACDIFLQPSREEAFGLVFLEAGLCSKPTVATDIGGIPEIIVNDKTGYLVKTHSPSLLADKLEELINSNDKLKSMGKAARLHIIQNFSLSRRIDHLENHLRSIAE